MTPAAIVACNIYITAASSHSSTLLSLLRRAQDQCRRLRLRHQQQQDGSGRDRCDARNSDSLGNHGMGLVNERMAPVAMVHAYADIPYDRSSFHLAGRSDCVADVASRLICDALNEIDSDCSPGVIDGAKSGKDTETRHPFVGLVDHVSVMPISHDATSSDGTSTDNQCEAVAAANAAREIGRRMSETNLVNVHYYGVACPKNTPLPSVRRERTSFFGSGGAIDVSSEERNETSTSSQIASRGDATVGTPSAFVENFNIRLTSNVGFDRAKTLTRFLRGRNIETKGCGVAGVEALTLPYVRGASEGGKVYEVACNLTKPKEGGADVIRSQLNEWIERQTQELSGNCNESAGAKVDASKYDYEYFVEDAYPVGTTEEQCKRVLSGKRLSEEGDMRSASLFWKEYDDEVALRFQDLLQ